ADLWMAGALLGRLTLDPVERRPSRYPAGIGEIHGTAKAGRGHQSPSDPLATRARLPLWAGAICAAASDAAREFGSGAARAAIPADHADDLACGLPEPVLHLRSDRLDTHGDAAAR